MKVGPKWYFIPKCFPKMQYFSFEEANNLEIGIGEQLQES